MTIWVAPAVVKARMSIDPQIAGVDAVIVSAEAGAVLRVESELETQLDLAYWTETFYLDPTMHNGIQPNGMFRLRLSNGLIRTDDDEFPFLVTCGSSWRDTSEPVPNTDYRLDAEKGILHVGSDTSPNVGVAAENGYSGWFVTVGYQAGFDPGSPAVVSPPTAAVDPEAIPGWMTEAILAFIPMVMNMSQTTSRSAESDAIAKMAERHALSIIARKLRPRGFTIPPMT